MPSSDLTISQLDPSFDTSHLIDVTSHMDTILQQIGLAVTKNPTILTDLKPVFEPITKIQGSTDNIIQQFQLGKKHLNQLRKREKEHVAALSTLSGHSTD